MRKRAVLDPKPGGSSSFAFTAEVGAPGEGVRCLQEKEPSGPGDRGRRDPDPDPACDEATVEVAP
ncbi:hypothetical protein OHT57_22180 [Streptomyces sp. NBC_00285]|uniref:hypothetical protein n=1 Tax=Streptomyces sp. NBC_00285 TaxID=2975700 RepID=UPI002E2974F7|nr:hypothetical protein [Streptomyces sp. NBC_00285]